MVPGLPNQNTDIACADGGAFQYSGTEANGTYNLTLQFNGCRDKGYQYPMAALPVNGLARPGTLLAGGGRNGKGRVGTGAQHVDRRR